MPVHHTGHPAGRRLRRTPVRDVLTTTIACVLATAFSAHAQDSAPAATPATDATTAAAPPVTLDNITVIGQRASLNQAVQAKQMSDHVMEVISADNMGQMPNVTVAEALVRLPGVNGTRDRGNESLATVRGLGPRMTMGTVNGREIASSEPNRAVRWEVFPTEIVSTVKVYKTQSADLVAGGLAATVDISTISPLDYTGPGFVGTAGPVFYDHAKDVDGYSPWGNRFGASWVHQINDNLAVALGATYQKQKNSNSSIGSWGYTDATTSRDVDGDGTVDPTPWGAADQLKLTEQTRTGAMGTVQWRSGNVELKFDGLYSRIEIDEDQLQNWFNGLAYSTFSTGANPYTTPGSSYTIVDGDVVAGTLANSNLQVDHVVSHYNEVKTLTAGGLNAKWSGDVWTLGSDLSFSQAKRDNTWQAVRFGSNPDTVSFDFRRSVTPTISTSSDTPEWGIAGQTEPQGLRDRIAALALNASRSVDAAAFTSLEFGARAARREKQNRRFISNQSGYDQPISAYQGLISPVTMPDLNVPTLTGGNMDAIAEIGFGGFDPATLEEQLLDHWNVKEDVREAFAKAVFSSQLFGTDITGNIGVRLVNTRTTSDGFDSVGTTVQASSDSKEYTDVLPSATVNFLIDDQRILRFAVAKVIARPPLDELRTGRRLDDPNVTVGQLTGSGGNPQLDPFKATQVDLSYEWYFHKGSAGGDRGVSQGSGFQHRLPHRPRSDQRPGLPGQRAVQWRRRAYQRCGTHLPDTVLLHPAHGKLRRLLQLLAGRFQPQGVLAGRQPAAAERAGTQDRHLRPVVQQRQLRSARGLQVPQPLHRGVRLECGAAGTVAERRHGGSEPELAVQQAARFPLPGRQPHQRTAARLHRQQAQPSGQSGRRRLSGVRPSLLAGSDLQVLKHR